MSLVAHIQAWIARQWQRRGLWALMLRPASWLYGYIANRRREAFQAQNPSAYRSPVPVIVVGNIYVGGTGKTPVTCAIAQVLQQLGWHPGLVSRGYGSQQSAMPVTGQGALDWRAFGDEPSLIARKTGIPVSVHRRRDQAARALLKAFPEVDVILSDDGLQHYALARDLEILIQDERGIGNGLLLPAGPLRESAERAQCVDLKLNRLRTHMPGNACWCSGVANSPAPNSLGQAAPQACFSVQIDGFWHLSTGTKVSVQQFIEKLGDQRQLIALAGIGVPQRFFDSLNDLGIRPDRTTALADHAPIDPKWLQALPQHAVKTILITEKDAVKCLSDTDSRVWVASTSVCWQCDQCSNQLMKLLEKLTVSQYSHR